MIVLDDQELRPLTKERAQLPAALLGEGGAGRVLRPRSDDDGFGGSGALHCRGEQPLVINSDRHRHERERVEKVDDAGEAGVFDENAVARAQLLAQHALDAVERAADDGDGIGGNTIAGELRTRHRHEIGVAEVIAIQPRAAVKLAEKRGQIGQHVLRRIAGGQIANMRGQQRGGGRGGGGGVADDRSAAAVGEGDAALLQDAVGGGHGGRADPELLRERAHGRKALAAGDPSAGCGRLRAGSDLDGGRTLEVALYWHMSDTVLEQSTSLQSPRTTVKRLAKRGEYGRETINGIIDEALICHVGFVVDGSPVVIPTIHTRIGETLYFHGSAASRMLRSLRGGIDACVTITLLDGLVMARSAFHHSMNYRSVVVMGKGREVVDREEKLRVLDALVEHVCAGRVRDARPPNETELRQTLVIAMPLTEASAKIRSGPAADEEEDYALPIWAGVIPLAVTPSSPIDDERLAAGVTVPEYATRYQR